MSRSYKDKVRRVSGWYKTEGFYQTLLELEFGEIRKFFSGRKALEIGPADGFHTARLPRFFDDVTCIEPAEKYCQGLSKKLGKRLRIIPRFLDEVELEETFDTILCAHLLEHLRNPVEALKKIARWMHSRSRLILIVPNANSLHRHVGVALGMLRSVSQLNGLDKKLGHFRVYDKNRLLKEVNEARLKVERIGGVMIKPLSNAQMESWEPKLVRALHRAGHAFPDWCADLIFVCRKKT